jgi:hypothetical protein
LQPQPTSTWKGILVLAEDPAPSKTGGDSAVDSGPSKIMSFSRTLTPSQRTGSSGGAGQGLHPLQAEGRGGSRSSKQVQILTPSSEQGQIGGSRQSEPAPSFNQVVSGIVNARSSVAQGSTHPLLQHRSPPKSLNGAPNLFGGASSTSPPKAKGVELPPRAATGLGFLQANPLGPTLHSPSPTLSGATSSTGKQSALNHRQAAGLPPLLRSAMGVAGGAAAHSISSTKAAPPLLMTASPFGTRKPK